MLRDHIRLAYHKTFAWYLNKRAAKASHDLKYSDHKSKASKNLRNFGTRSNVHEAMVISIEADLLMEKLLKNRE